MKELVGLGTRLCCWLSEGRSIELYMWLEGTVVLWLEEAVTQCLEEADRTQLMEEEAARQLLEEVAMRQLKVAEATKLL